MKTIVCVYLADFKLGGIESYFMRIFHWGHVNKYNTVLITLFENTIHASWRDDLEKNNVQIVYMKTGLCRNHVTRLEGGIYFWNPLDQYFVITTDIHSYLRMYTIKEQSKLKEMSIVLYSFLTTNGVGTARKLFNIPFKPFFKTLAGNGLIMMDEECRQYCEQINEIALSDECIVRLGMPMVPLSERIINTRSKSRKERFVILSVTRMSFPFKGYVLGLLDTFKKLCMIYENIELILIGTGEDQIKITEKIGSFSDGVKKHIKLVPEVPYSKMMPYFQNAHIYIGMGTTLLDSAMTGLISVISTAYSYKPQTIGFFADHPNNLSGNMAINNGRVLNFEECIVEVFHYSDEQYFQKSKEQYQVLQRAYDINKIAPLVLESTGKASFKGFKFFVLRTYANFFSLHKYWKKDRKNR